MGIYNLNPRRVVWFSPNEPSNKYDIWLSRNAHLDENGEPTTDSNSQRDCDYIFKIYDCGKWNPIVGFNTTAANKIDIVEGNTLNHPALFTGNNPNDLYDYGKTLGQLLSDPNFVENEDWYNVFNSPNYSWSHIFGDNNWFGDLIWQTIQGGSSTYHLPFATTERCGGILSATHPAASSAFKPIEVKFYPTVQGYYQNEQHRLCVSASDVIQQINNYYNDNPGGSSININWNSTTIHQLAEVLQDVFKNSSSLGFEDVWSLASDPHVYPHIWGVSPSNAGKFLRINPQWNDEGIGWSQSNNNMDWVDLSDWINDNFDWRLATVSDIGGANVQTSDGNNDYRGVPVLFGGPNIGLTYDGNTPQGFTLFGDSSTYNPHNSFLYVPVWALLDVLKNPTGSQTPASMIRNGFGTFTQWLHDEHADLDYCTVSLKATPNADKGKFLKIKDDGSDIEFTDIFTNGSTITLNYSNNKEKLDIRHKQSDSSNVVFAFNIYNGTTLVEENERRTGTSTNVIVQNGACNIVFGNQGGNTPTPLYIKLAVASGASCSINYDFSDQAIHQVINPIKAINNKNGSQAAIYFITIQMGIVKFEEVTVITTSAE